MEGQEVASEQIWTPASIAFRPFILYWHSLSRDDAIAISLLIRCGASSKQPHECRELQAEERGAACSTQPLCPLECSSLSRRVRDTAQLIPSLVSMNQIPPVPLSSGPQWLLQALANSLYLWDKFRRWKSREGAGCA